MNSDEYLQQTLASQNLDEDSDELKALRENRDAVEKLLRKNYGSVPTIRYGGSKAKGTMNKESYDLDIICYFPRDSAIAGKTLKEIYNNVRAALEKDYIVDTKTSALRLKSRALETYKVNLQIDVVPGRYSDGDEGDVLIYQSSGEKEYLKTNLQIHIDHIRDSGVVEVIRLTKLWRVRNSVPVKQFILELLTIKLLRELKSSILSNQLCRVWQEFRDHPKDLAVEDPANPTGNDLSKLIEDARWSLSSIASSTLATIENNGWEAAFGKVTSTGDADKKAALHRMVTATSVPTRPWWNVQ